MIMEVINMYLIQAILIDNHMETVIDSIKSNDYNKILDFLMKKHKHSYHYIYNVLDIESNILILNTNFNKFQ